MRDVERSLHRDPLRQKSHLLYLNQLRTIHLLLDEHEIVDHQLVEIEEAQSLWQFALGSYGEMDWWRLPVGSVVTQLES
jgi:hypothetical protein